LGGEDQPTIYMGVVERLHSGTIAHEEKSPAFAIPQPDCEVAVQLFEKAIAILLVKVEYDFGVGIRTEAVAFRFQGLAHLRKIVNLAVEGQPDGFVRCAHRLVTSLAQVNDGEAPMCEAALPIFLQPYPAAIRPSMSHGRGHNLKQ